MWMWGGRDERARVRKQERELRHTHSALENGWVGPPMHELMREKGREFLREAQRIEDEEGDERKVAALKERAKGIALGLAVLRGTKAKDEWRMMMAGM